jgi:hypothetical protein
MRNSTILAIGWLDRSVRNTDAILAVRRLDRSVSDTDAVLTVRRLDRSVSDTDTVLSVRRLHRSMSDADAVLAIGRLHGAVRNSTILNGCEGQRAAQQPRNFNTPEKRIPHLYLVLLAPLPTEYGTRPRASIIQLSGLK